MSKLIILNSSGDERLEWDQNDPQSVELAEAAFNQQIKLGHRHAFAIDENGDGQMVEVFDKTATKIIVAPQISGG